MKILGIDPGFSATGYGIVQKEGQRLHLIAYDILTFGRKPLPEKIGIFHTHFNQIIKEHQIQGLALETPFLGKNAQNFLKLGYLRGIVYLLAHTHNLKVMEFSPSEVKKAVTGFGAASKEQVARVMTQLFKNFTIPKKLDATDALAVSLCGVWQAARRRI